MREKINQLAEGKFEYQKSGIVAAPERLEWENATGQICQGSLVVSNSKRQLMKGIVTADCPEITVEPMNFRGVDNEIQIQVQTDRMKKGDIFQSGIQIISDCGICEVPIQIKKEQPVFEAAGKKIRDMAAFVELARTNFEEAVRIFDEELFYSEFLAKDKEGKALYEGLRPMHNRRIALEEFLAGLGRKEPLEISAGQIFRQYDGCKESFRDVVTIQKNTWGYGEIRISADASFVRIPKEKVVTTEFVGESLPFEFIIEPDKMVPGKNFARIEIATFRQRITVSITAVKPGIEHEQAQKNRREQRTLCQLLKRHMTFCMNRLPLQDYLQEMDRLLQGSGLEKNSMRLQLYRIHIAIIEHQTAVVKEGLEELESQAEVLHRDAPELYAGYYYLKGLWSGEEEVVGTCVERIRECYEQQGQNAQVLWCLLYLDPAMQSGRKRYHALVEQLKMGCYSPLFYLEVCQLLNDSPELLKELTEELVQALHWGCKSRFLEKEIALRYVYLAGRLRYYSAGILEDMTLLYERYEEDEILTAICKMLMKGQITSKDAFAWYAKGVEHNLKITDLYEYYMYSLDEEREPAFTHSVLLYFLYDNHLTVEKKSMLYAYITKKKEVSPDTYESYRLTIQNFALEQLKEGRINANLALLYEEFITEETLDEELAGKLAGIMFRRQLVCHNPHIRGVYVRHPELAAEEYVPLIKGRAVITCMTGQMKLFLADGSENRYADTSDYTLTPLLHMEHMAKVCLRYQRRNRPLLLYLGDKADREPGENRHTMEIRRNILELEGLSETYRRRVQAKLIHYYYANGEHELLEQAMEELDWSQVVPGDRERFIEYCALCKCHEKAMEGILQFGFAGIPLKRLETISQKAFRDISAIPDERMLCLGWKLFTGNAYGEDVLTYMMRFYSGRVKNLVRLWQAAEAMDLETTELEERLIAQSVFSGEIVPEVFDVFQKYQEHAENRQVVIAFKKWMAYEYLLHGVQLPESLFASYFKDVQIQDNLPCLLAVLKFFSGRESLTEEESRFADYHVNRLYDQKMVFPFFKKFKGRLTLPVHVTNQLYIEYITDSDYEVTIHYRVISEGEPGAVRVEKMRNVFEGIRVKEFVLFEDEELEYYVTEHRPTEDVRSETKRVAYDGTSENINSGSRYHRLNEMMHSLKSGEDEKLIDLMEEFVMDREVAAAIFKPM